MRLGTVFSIIVCTSGFSSAIAGPVQPTWVELVEVNVFEGETTVTQFDAGPPGFSIANFLDGRAGGGVDFFALVDYQGITEPPILAISYAGWMSGTTYDVPLYISAFPASPGPPIITDPPTYEAGAEFDIPVGDYSSAPYLIPLNDVGDVCYLLGTGSSTTFGSGVISFLIDPPAAVPEPTSWLLLIIPLILLIGIYLFQWLRRSKCQWI